MSIGRELLNVPFPEMVYQLASAIAKAQANLDRESIEILRIMGDKTAAPVSLPSFEIKPGEDNFIVDTEIETSMIGAGFQPTFYQFAETIIEVKMAITATRESESVRHYSGKETRISWLSGYRRLAITSTPVDATYSNKYNYTQEGASLLRTRLVPVPPNNIIQRQLDMRSEALQLEYELKMAQLENDLADKRSEIEQTKPAKPL